jgi:integrase
MALRLTSAVVKAAEAPSITWDADTKGLALRVFGGGTRTFVLKYRIAGRERQYKIGNFPTWSVEAARAEAKDLRKRIDQGHDPAGEKRERREAATMTDLVDRYAAEHMPTKRGKLRDLGYMAKRVEYRETAERKVLDEIAQHLGRHSKVADIHGGDIQAMHRALTRDHGPVMANRMLGICSRMFSLTLVPVAGENKPWRDQAQGNPCKGIARNHEEGRERFYSQAELAAIATALDEYGGDVRSEAAVNAIRLVMLTGCRPQEARLAQWSEFEEAGVWVKPSAHMKTNRTHRLPLSPGAVELIERLRKKRKAGQWVFPGQKRGEPLATLEHPWKFVRQHAGLAPTDRLYDLRHSFASIGAGGGLSLPIIGRLLGHTNPKTTARYAHLSDDPLKEAAERIGAVIANAGNAGAVVVRMPRTKR